MEQDIILDIFKNYKELIIYEQYTRDNYKDWPGFIGCLKSKHHDPESKDKCVDECYITVDRMYSVSCKTNYNVPYLNHAMNVNLEFWIKLNKDERHDFSLEFRFGCINKACQKEIAINCKCLGEYYYQICKCTCKFTIKHTSEMTKYNSISEVCDRIKKELDDYCIYENALKRIDEHIIDEILYN